MTTEILRTVQNGDELQMICEADFSIANALTIREALLLSIARDGNESLLLSNVTSIDITGIQLVFNWREALKSQNRIGKVVWPDAEEIKDLLQKVGIVQIF